jgi:hypothetical protein
VLLQGECTSGCKFKQLHEWGVQVQTIARMRDKVRAAEERRKKEVRVPGNAHCFAKRSDEPDSLLCRFAPRLFLLQGLDIAVDVRDALLYFGIVTLAQVAEQRTPHWHVLAAVRGQFCIAPEDAGHMQVGGWGL